MAKKTSYSYSKVTTFTVLEFLYDHRVILMAFPHDSIPINTIPVKLAKLSAKIDDQP